MNVNNITRVLRRNQTYAESLFWKAVRNRALNGLKVRRQHPVTFRYNGMDKCFVADFYFPEIKIIVEIDGSIHDEQQDYDIRRDRLLSDLGYEVLRFTNDEIETDIKNVFDIIVGFSRGIKTLPRPSPSAVMLPTERG